MAVHALGSQGFLSLRSLEFSRDNCSRVGGLESATHPGGVLQKPHAVLHSTPTPLRVHLVTETCPS